MRKSSTLHVPLRVLGLQLEINRIRQSLVERFDGCGEDLAVNPFSPAKLLIGSRNVVAIMTSLPGVSLKTGCRVLALKPL